MKFVLIALFLAAVVLATEAAEEGPSCLCTREMAPVCATDGITYPNKCQFECAKGQLQGRAADGFRIARGGPCDGPEIPEFAGELR